MLQRVVRRRNASKAAVMGLRIVLIAEAVPESPNAVIAQRGATASG